MVSNQNHYKAISNGSLNLSLNFNQQQIGQLLYKNWYSNSACIQLNNGNRYSFESKGFLSSSTALRDGDRTLMEFEINWNGISLTSLMDGSSDRYFLNLKGFWSNVFLLCNSEGTAIAEVRADFVWRKLSYNFQITTNHGFESIVNKEVFLLAMLHCVNHYVTTIVQGS